MPQASDQESGSVNLRSVSNASREFTQAPESLTPEQQIKRLEWAKQAAKAQAEISRARVKQLDKVLLPVESELQSLAKVEVGYAIERWREAWSKGDLTTYLSSYSSQFKPANGLTLGQWKSVRKSRVKPEKEIDLKLIDFDVVVAEPRDAVVVEFKQRYQSGPYLENSRKRLSLNKEQGLWKITSEAELPQ